MSETKAYPLRLPRPLKDAVERISKEEGTSITSSLRWPSPKGFRARNGELFSGREARADFKTFDRIMKQRSGRQPPRAGARSGSADNAHRALSCFHATVLRLFKNRKTAQIRVRKENVAHRLQPTLSFFGEQEAGRRARHGVTDAHDVHVGHALPDIGMRAPRSFRIASFQ